MSGKLYKQVQEKAPQDIVSVADAVAFIKEHTRKTFDETVEVHVNLGINHTKTEQMVRGSVQLPSGSPNQKTIAVFAVDAAKQKEAKDAGAQIVGGQELIDEVAAKGALNAEVTIATPDMMPMLAKIARVLGPKGLMPSPKAGTVTPDIAKAVKELSSGKVSFKMDQTGNIHEAIGKASWDAEKIIANVEAIVEAIRAARPATAKGELIRTITVCSTMSPGLRVSL